MKPLQIDDEWAKLRGHRRELDRLRARAHGRWVYVGGTWPGSPDFLAGSNMDPTAAIPNPVPLRFRWLLGGGLEIQGDVTGVAPGDTVFVLPDQYRLDHDVPVHSHDDAGVYVPCRLLATGEFIYGVP